MRRVCLRGWLHGAGGVQCPDAAARPPAAATATRSRLAAPREHTGKNTQARRLREKKKKIPQEEERKNS